EGDPPGAQHGQGLPAENMAPACGPRRRHRTMLNVGRAHVHDVDIDVAKRRTIIGAGVRHAKGIGHRPRLVDVAADDDHDVREAETPYGFEVYAAHETGSNDRGPNALSSH